MNRCEPLTVMNRYEPLCTEPLWTVKQLTVVNRYEQ